MVFVRAAPKLPTLLLPIRIVAGIFGISLITFPQRKLLIYLNIAYTIVHFTLAISLTLYRLGHIQPQFCQQNPVSHSVNGIQQLLGLTVVVAVYYQAIFRKTGIQTVLKLLAKSHNDLLQLNIIQKYRVFGIKIVVETVSLMLFVCTVFVVFAIHYDVISVDALAFEYFSAMNPLILANLMLLMFINVCWHIRNELCILRQSIEDTIVNSMMRLETMEAGQAHDRLLNGNAWTIKVYSNDALKILSHRLQHIARIYETLHDATQALNRTFGLSNLTSIGNLFIQSILLYLMNRIFISDI